MMNGTAVLPAVVTTFAGNAATISAGSVQNGSASGTAGGFSDTLGAMVTSGQQSNMNSAVRMNADNKAVMNGEILSGLNELEQNAQELKELLKTAELAGYLQGGTMQFYADAMQTGNSELMQIMNGLEVSNPIGDVLSEEGAFSKIADGNDINTALGLQNGEISAVNDFASEIQMNNGDSADSVNQANVNAKIASGSIADDNAVTVTADKSDAFASVAVGNAEKSSDADNVRSKADTTFTDKTDNIGSRETAVIKADGVKADSVKADSPEAVKAEFTVTSYEKYGDNSVKQDIQTQDNSTQRMAFAKRNIESKSDELRAIAKGNEVTKSDSDLETEQKVTDKNAVSDMLAKGSDVFARTESRYDENGQEIRTVRVPISDMAEFVSEHAPKANGKSTLTVVLTPETLGKITVRMANEGGKLTVEILTETQAAKELLQAKSQQLAYALKNDDVELTSYKVETSQAELFQRDFDGSSKNPYRQQSHSQQKNDTDDFENLLGEIQTMD
ncbi:MAG: flagellar hook-length control protein FliK [Ruminiclostridium sp.]|nr:flagellar hook-length control protein FliK [Ruminiclostridium sp.]